MHTYIHTYMHTYAHNIYSSFFCIAQYIASTSPHHLILPLGGFKLLLARHASLEKAPAVLLMHQTGGCKESMADALERLARQGLLAVSFDAPHHGERALPEAGLRLGGDP